MFKFIGYQENANKICKAISQRKAKRKRVTIKRLPKMWRNWKYEKN